MQIFLRTLQSGVVPLAIGENPTFDDLKACIERATGVPSQVQRLRCGVHDVTTASVIEPESTVCLLLRLVGGKGGFGSLLRVQGRDTKATTNFEACRDLSGRRLRHVNAVKKMEEWRQKSKERELEDVALKYVTECVRNGRKEKRKAIDPATVTHLQREAVSNVKNAVQSALQSKHDLPPPQRPKRAKFERDQESSSDESDEDASIDDSRKNTAGPSLCNEESL